MSARQAMRFRRPTLIAALALVLGGCAGATLGSGVGDRYFDAPPYYAGGEAPSEAAPVLTTLRWRGRDIVDPAAGPSTAVAVLLGEMAAYLSDEIGLVVHAADAPGSPPDVLFGCETDLPDECVEREEEGRRGPPLRLAVGRPSASWVSWMQGEAADVGARWTIVLTLEVGQLWPYQKNFRGDKEVALGSNHTVGVPWLTSLDAPVRVLQLTGALVDATGRARRIGAEGLMVRPTSIVASGFGIQRLVTDEDVAALRTARRSDLPGDPLVWRVALSEMVEGLLGIHASTHVGAR